MRLTLDSRFRRQIDKFIYDPWDEGIVVLAVSGGGDSTTLMHLAAEVLPAARLHVATVDHGLRDVSGEIAKVEEQARALGLLHSVLRWEWDGTGNLQAAARDGRWNAIETLAARLGAEHGCETCCLTGHTKDDQAETVLLRLARGSGVAGLSGMQTVGQSADGLRIVRPLLGETREELRNWLVQRNISWTDDPSNDDPRFDRVKARAMMANLSSMGLTTDRLVQTAEHMQSARREMSAHAVSVAKESVTQKAGDILLPANWAGQDEVGFRLFQHALHYVGGGPYAPRAQAAAALWKAARAGQSGTLHGCCVVVEGDLWRVFREKSAVAEPKRWNNQSMGCRWDVHWLISQDTNCSLGGKFVVRSLGDAIKDVPDWRETGLPRASLMASPAVFDGETLISAPVAGYNNGFEARIVTDFSSFLLSR